MIPKSTHYKAVDKAGVVQAAGNKKDMRLLCKKNKGWQVWVIETTIGQNVYQHKGVKNEKTTGN